MTNGPIKRSKSSKALNSTGTKHKYAPQKWKNEQYNASIDLFTLYALQCSRPRITHHHLPESAPN